jgi:hypothetical protein
MSTLEWVKWVILVAAGFFCIGVYWSIAAWDESWYVKVATFIAAHGYSAGIFWLFVKRVKAMGVC